MADPPCVLSYRFATAPSPLQVSGSAQASPGLVQIQVSAPAGQVVYVSKFLIGVQIGPEADDFCTDSPELTPNTLWWSAAAPRTIDGPELGLPAGSWTAFTVTCKTQDYWKLDYDLAFSLTTAAVNPTVGPFQVGVIEYSGPDVDSQTKHTTYFGLQKTPIRLYLNNLISTAGSSASSLLPKTEFAAGEALTLSWASNGSSFTVYDPNAPEPVTTADTSYTVDSGAPRDTTYVVVGTSSGTPGVAKASISVTITDPITTPRSTTGGELTVARTATMSGSVELGETRADGLLTVAHAAKLNVLAATMVTVTGDSTLTTADLDLASVAGALGAQSATLASTRVGDLTVNDSLAALTKHPVTAGRHYTAPGDGFLFGRVWYRDDVQTGYFAATISGACDAAGFAPVYATGGSLVVRMKPDGMGSMTPVWGSDSSSFLLPVPAGSSFHAEVKQYYDSPAVTEFAWYSLAANAAPQPVSGESA